MPKDSRSSKKQRSATDGDASEEVAHTGKRQPRASANRWGCTHNAIKRYAEAGGLARANQLAHKAVDHLLDKFYGACLRYAATKAFMAGQTSVPLQAIIEGAKHRCGVSVVGVRPKPARIVTAAKKGGAGGAGGAGEAGERGEPVAPAEDDSV